MTKARTAPAYRKPANQITYYVKFLRLFIVNTIFALKTVCRDSGRSRTPRSESWLIRFVEYGELEHCNQGLAECVITFSTFLMFNLYIPWLVAMIDRRQLDVYRAYTITRFV